MKSFFLNIVLFFFLFFNFKAFSQITTDNAAPYNTEQYLVNDVLLGSGLTTSNFLSQGFAQGIGYFDGTNANIGFDEGVILSTGGLDFVTGGFGGGSGISGEADLELALNQINLFWDVNNVTVLEFDFVAESESVTFNYVFGSSEYTGYTCSVFNDIFGFFLSGPGINGIYSNNAVNLAYIPDPEGFNDYQTWLDNNTGLYTNTPVAVNTVNSGEPSGFGGSAQCDEIDPNWGSYNIFWIDNDYAFGPYQGPNPPPAPEGTVQGLTGFTVPLQATYNGLICGETYHIKLAIADASDTALNSVVFLEANSFSSPAVEVSSFNSEAELSGSSVLEGCGDLNLQFIRSGDMSMDLDLSLSYSGDAVMGVDYENLPDQIVIPANQEEFVLPIEVFYDGVGEGIESIIITVEGASVECSDLDSQVIELSIIDQEELIVQVPNLIEADCFGEIAISAQISGGTEPYFVSWFDEQGVLISNELTINPDPEFNTFYSVEVTDECGDQIVSATTNVEVLPAEVSVSLPPDISLCEGDPLSLNPTIEGGLEPYFYIWYYNGSVISTEQNLEFDVVPEGLYQFIVQEGCGGLAGAEIEVSYINPSPYVELSSNDVPNPAVLPEGCFQSSLDFILIEPSEEDISVEFSVGGTAVYGEDYLVSSFEVFIPAGQTTASIAVEIIEDDVFEGSEEIEFYFDFIDPCSDWPNQLSISINEVGALYATAPENIIVCEDELDEYTISGVIGGGVGLVNYGWYFEEELISTDINIPVLGLTPGTYSLVATDQCNNVAQANVNLQFIYLTPSVEIVSDTFDDPLFLSEACGLSTLVFEMPYAYPNDTVFYYETYGNATLGEDLFDLPGFVEVPAGVTTVNVDLVPIPDNIQEENETLTFSFPFIGECSSQDNIEITINNIDPIVITVPDSLTVCSGQEINLEASYFGGVEPMQYYWSTPEGIIESLNLTSYPENDWEYIFYLEDACGYSASSSVFVEAEDYEAIEVLWPPLIVDACIGEQDFIIPEISGGVGNIVFDWFIDGQLGENSLLSGYDVPFMFVPTDDADSFEYQMAITDDCNNTIYYDFDVNVTDCAAPNVFTPNGDGNNDYFLLEFGTVNSGANLEVYNRWGELVFNSQNYVPCSYSSDSCWDGSFFNQGEPCPDGVYFYKLNYNNAQTPQKSGYIMLTR